MQAFFLHWIKANNHQRALCFFLFLFAAFTNNSSAQNQAPCSGDTIYQLLDFWVGEWKVYDHNNDWVGDNHIEKILEGCAIIEHWTGKGGSKGKSLFYVDNNSRNWKQVWVTERSGSSGGQKEKTLMSFQPGISALFQGSYELKGRNVLDRTILTLIKPGEVKQDIQISHDGGLSWQSTFIGYYRKF